jgi:tRNA-specific 2-thiouridylase
MPELKTKVVVALSGGVDSSTAAALLLEAGCECLGVFMITSEQNRHSVTDVEDVARNIGIELRVLDLRPQFEHILDYFCREYGQGRTPNPCVVCNRLIKFGKLWDFTREVGAELLATGHYARTATHDADSGLYQGVDTAKDQSYVLSMVDRHMLSHITLPLGEYSKSQTRRIARRLGLGTETKEESQEICFIPDDDYVGVVEKRYPALAREGRIVDSSGKVLGAHRGVHRYTIGQRKGLRIAMGRPYYVTRLDAATNTVVLGPKEEVMHRRLSATRVNWLVDKPESPFRATVKIRYNDRGKPATVIPDGGGAHVEFEEPNMAITPGQLAVFYVDEDEAHRVAGAGWIDKVED